ncbi:Non-histone chromosomal protein 6 [Sorochytrium milnesiophthora]
MPKEVKDTEVKSVRKTRASPKEDARKRKKKDPNAPKRPSTAFFVFSADKRNEVKQANPGATVGTIAKVLGDMWKKLTEEEKKPYNERAAQDKVRYEQDMQAYNEAKASAHDVGAEDEEEEDEE